MPIFVTGQVKLNLNLNARKLEQLWASRKEVVESFGKSLISDARQKLSGFGKDLLAEKEKALLQSLVSLDADKLNHSGTFLKTINELHDRWVATLQQTRDKIAEPFENLQSFENDPKDPVHKRMEKTIDLLFEIDCMMAQRRRAPHPHHHLQAAAAPTELSLDTAGNILWIPGGDHHLHDSRSLYLIPGSSTKLARTNASTEQLDCNNYIHHKWRLDFDVARCNLPPTAANFNDGKIHFHLIPLLIGLTGSSLVP